MALQSEDRATALLKFRHFSGGNMIVFRNLLVCSVVFLACLSLASPGDTIEPPPKRQVKALVMPYLNFGPYFIAQEEGYFEEQGLDVEFVRFTMSSQALPAILAGDLDVIAGLPVAGCFNAMAQGAPLRFVADRGHLPAGRQSSTALMVRPELLQDGTLQNPESLNGLNICVGTPTASLLVLYEALVEEWGWTMEDMDLVHIRKMSERLHAFASNAVDISLINEPHATLFRRSGHAVDWKNPGNIKPGFQHSVHMYGPNLVVEDVEKGKLFMTAFLKGLRQYNQGKTQRNLDIMQKYTNVERDVLEAAVWPSLWQDGSINVHSILEIQQWFLKKGLIEEVLPVESFWDPRFINHANQVLGDL